MELENHKAYEHQVGKVVSSLAIISLIIMLDAVATISSLMIDSLYRSVENTN